MWLFVCTVFGFTDIFCGLAEYSLVSLAFFVAQEKEKVMKCFEMQPSAKNLRTVLSTLRFTTISTDTVLEE